MVILRLMIAVRMARMFNVSPLIVSPIVAGNMLNLCLQARLEPSLADSGLLYSLAPMGFFNIYGY